MKFLATLLVLLMLPCLALAEPPATTVIEAWPWTSLGRVNREDGGMCSGALVAPDRVLTAAHCLYDRRTQRWVRPAEMHFLAGYVGGRYLAHGRARAVEFAARHDVVPNADTHDWAILRLEQPLGLKPIPLAPPPAQGTPLVLAGYGRDRALALTMHAGCVLAGWRHGLLLHSCASMPGISGAPLLVLGPPRIVGVHIGASQGLGVAVPVNLALLLLLR